MQFIPINGKLISKSELIIPKAKEVASSVENLDYYTLVEIRKQDNSSENEILVIDFDIEIGQVIKNDINRIERIAIEFSKEDLNPPKVFALRDNFPKVPHLFLEKKEKPRSLCIFDEEYSEVKLSWTPTNFLERIREWLSLTAKGLLHQDDQQLEPLLVGNTINIILPKNIFKKIKDTDLNIIKLRLASNSNNQLTLIAGSQNEKDWFENQSNLKFISIIVEGEPQTHGFINYAPSNLAELDNFLKKANVEILPLLRNKVLPLVKEKAKESSNPEIMKLKLILILNLPKKRVDEGDVESSETWAFLLDKSIEDLGCDIELWLKSSDGYLVPNLDTNYTKDGSDINIDMLKPIYSFSKENAKLISGLDHIEEKKILLVGCGALGSQVFMNFIRMGYGHWTIIDNDILLPHNLSRHALGEFHVGFSKAEGLAWEANQMMKDENNIEAISENVLQNNNPRLTSKYEDTDVIIDASASIPVARYLANNINNKARIVSIFFNPLGNDCVLIAEDKNRKFTLDALEIQYYKHLINNSELENHLQTGKRFRYARSCGDLSFVMQQDLVALHSSICTRAILETLRKEEASVVIWSTQLDDFTVKKHVVDLYNINKQIFKDWTLYYDEGLLRKVYDARISKLPKETGGILIGSYDTQRKIVYVTDTILSPSDSKEYPNSYIRGCQNLKEAEESIKEITLSRLQYVGEWHSHPKGFNTRPSNDDKKLFDWIKEIMKIDGYPPLMLIVGDKTNYTWYLGEIN